MSVDRTYPFDEDLLDDVNWLGEVLGIGERYMITVFMLSLAVGVRENCPRQGSHKKSNRGPRTGLKDQEFALMQSVVSAVSSTSDLEPGTDDFVATICSYSNGGLMQIRAQLKDMREPRAALVAYLEQLADETEGSIGQ
mgnify:CR=1 FL=1